MQSSPSSTTRSYLNTFPFLLIVSILLFPSILNAQSIEGKYKLIKESDGQVPKSQAEITLTFTNAGFSFKAIQPGQTVDDKGSYKITGNNIVLTFKEMSQGRQSGTYTLVNGILTLPFKMMSDGKGSSTWQQLGPGTVANLVSSNSVNSTIKANLEGAKSKAKYINLVDSRATATSKTVNGGLAEGYYIEATRFYFKGFYLEAIYGYAKAAEIQPTNALYLNNLSMLIMDRNRYADAVVLLREVTHNFPNLAMGWGNLAIANLKLNNLSGADSAIRIARRLSPKDGLYCYTDGKIEEEKGRTKEAQKKFEEAWELGYAGSGREGGKKSKADEENNPNKKNQQPKPSPVKPKPSNKNNPKSEEDKIAQWEGHYEAKAVRARSGETGADANTKFGTGIASTNINLQTLACAKEFSMDISRMGNITGNGKVMYVYQGTAGNALTGLTPGAIAPAGGFASNLKDGYQIRDWSFSGTVDAEGNIEINGMPQGELDLLNVGKWQKIKTWSPFPPDAAGAAMKGPFHMKVILDEKLGPYIYVDQYLELNDKLIRRVHYQAYIMKTDANLNPDCKYVGPEAQAKCPASEFIKTKLAFSPLKHISVEASNTFTKGADGVQSQQEMAVNVGDDFSVGLATGSYELHQDNSMEFTIGIGAKVSDLVKGSPIDLEQKIELIYDTKCGFGVKGSAAFKNELSSSTASVEGVIFFNKGL